jgi:putative membrane protein
MTPVTGEDDLPVAGERASPAPGDRQAGGEPTVGDASRRTHLANERTYLAWWRTGVTLLAAAIGVGRVVPSLIHEPRWPYAILGAGYAVIGIASIAYGFRRQRAVREAIDRGRFSHPDERALLTMTAVGVALGLLLLVVILIEF